MMASSKSSRTRGSAGSTIKSGQGLSSSRGWSGSFNYLPLDLNTMIQGWPRTTARVFQDEEAVNIRIASTGTVCPCDRGLMFVVEMLYRLAGWCNRLSLGDGSQDYLRESGQC